MTLLQKLLHENILRRDVPPLFYQQLIPASPEYSPNSVVWGSFYFLYCNESTAKFRV